MQILRASVLGIGLAGAFLALGAGTARADRDDWHHGWQREHWRGWERPYYGGPRYVPRYYAPPPVYYPPPPVYYAPPPVYYGSPGITFSFR